ncbi:trafficking protein particle complex subunit 10 [Spea bombifrons]|uniref:trafficking protein particle complex subunit 10 n=1 Tax=Spea bombifrons TaxID=233779 RepID=UPI00234AF8BB|nr:trafficking protein particle complex subunit 10 [Spea bombifrons]
MEGAGPGDTGNGSGTGEPGVVYTMENKPIVTCAGDQTLFTAVYSTLTQQLPREPMEWRRAYGRAPKMIHLESNFVQFKEELLPREGNKALLTFPFLHIYWTECCDTEVYKATTKDDITKWQNALRAHSSTDWLIVVVESEAKKKNKTNILPRTSIADKIRSDFCNKQSDRCMVLVDPLKDTARSQESWFLFLAKLRTLLLTSFTRNLGRFEDDMRTLREKRTEPGWSFCDYFMVQEELAFVFEMLQQFEDALVQYDELDALFSQYVLNFGAGDGANWLSSFCQPVRGWDGLALRKPIDMEKRDLIQKRRANLLELRSYLFSRQCTLLLFLQRPWEVAGRALELLHNCVQELRLLEVSVPPGALDCWVFLSCLEVLQRIEGCCDRAQMEANVAHTVGLWSYATEKLRSLGSLCGLVSESGPGSEELQRTVDLLAGLGAERPETANAAQSPYKTLQEALSSEEAFEKHYLDLSHATIEMYNSIGRTRSARLVGKDLADFYMRKSSPQKAEPFLQGALQMYQSEAWSLPLTHTRKQLADCQRRLAQTQPYLQTCCLLAADGNLSHEQRRVYCQELLAFAKQSPTSTGAPLCLPLGSFAELVSLRFEPATAVVHVGGSLRMELTLLSRMPEPLQLDHLTGHFHYSLDKNSYRKTAQWLMRHKPAGGTVTFQTEGAPGARGQPPVLELSEMYEKSPSEGGLASTGVICRNVHMLIRPQDAQASSTPSPLDRQSVVSVDDGAHALRCSDVTLKPGINKLTFHAQAKEPGTYSLRQLTASVGDINLLLPHIYPIVQYDVYSQEPQLTVEPLSDCLLAGVPQKLKFTVTSGHYSVKEGDALQLSNADSMHVLGGGSPMAAIYRNSHEEVHHGALRIQRSEKVTSICLPPAPPYHLMEFELDVVCLLPEGGRLLNGELPRGGRETQDSCKSNTCEQRVSVDCPWSIYSTIISLTFHLPLKAQHKLLSSGTRKYIQVCVENLCAFGFRLSDSHLTSTQDLQLLPLHTAGIQDIQSQQRMFFVWEVTWRQHMPAFLPIHFSVGFSPVPDLQPCEHLQPFTYSFHLENFFTLYTVRAEISPPPDAPFCKTGALCSLEVCVTRLCDRLEAEETLTDCEGYSSSQLFYQVVDGGSNWAVCGRSSGVVLMPVRRGSCHTVRMEVMPLFAGYLPYPDVRLFRYLPHHSHSQQLDADSWIENDSVSVEDPIEGPGGRSQGSSSLSPGPVGSSKEQKGLPMPRLQPFHAGQVSNSSIGRQILVIPSSDEHVLEVNVT